MVIIAFLITVGCSKEISKTRQVVSRPLSLDRLRTGTSDVGVELTTSINSTLNKTIVDVSSEPAEIEREGISDEEPVIIIEYFNKDSYEQISLEQVQKSADYKYSSFDMGILNRHVFFEGRVFPIPIDYANQNATIGIMLYDGAEEASLNDFDFLLNRSISLACQIDDFKVVSCGSVEPFAEYRFYGTMKLTDNSYGIPDLKVIKFELHAFSKIGDVAEEFLLNDSKYCDADIDCKWVSINCCPETSGAEWVCLNEQVETHLCSLGWKLCNEFVSPKPTSSCVCTDNQCSAEE